MDFLFANGAIWFSVPALLGALVLVLQLLLGQLGGDLDADIDTGVDVGGDFGEGDSPGAEFGWLSMQTISAFATGSEWMGLAALWANN